MILQERSDKHRSAYILEAFATLAVAQKQMEQATRLFGATAVNYDQTHFFRSPIECTTHDQAIASARAALGEEAFAAAWAEGRMMTMEQAIEYALEDQDS